MLSQIASDSAFCVSWRVEREKPWQRRNEFYTTLSPISGLDHALQGENKRAQLQNNDALISYPRPYNRYHMH